MARQSRRRPTDRTILVVDDQQEVLLSVRGLLEREGHQVLTAESGEQALAVFENARDSPSPRRRLHAAHDR